jgi:DNA polymerase-1
LRGPVDDTMLLSYALNPTHATQSLADVAARHGQPASSSLAAGRSHHSCADSPCSSRKRKSRRQRVYRDIDLPLAPVLFRMEQAGVRIDTGALDGSPKRFSHRAWSA